MPVQRSEITKIEQHIITWNECQQCTIGRHSDVRVFYRGYIPAEVLIIGEAPGDVETVLRKPFVGPAGKLLDKIISEAFSDRIVTVCITNTILCVPADPPQLKLRQPSDDEIGRCSSRLQAFYNMVRPRHVIAAGKIAEKAIKRLRSLEGHQPPAYVAIPHPASILRQGEQGSLDYKRSVSALQALYM